MYMYYIKTFCTSVCCLISLHLYLLFDSCNLIRKYNVVILLQNGIFSHFHTSILNICETIWKRQEYKVIMHHQIYAMRIELSKKTLMTIVLDIRHVYTFHTVDYVLFFFFFVLGICTMSLCHTFTQQLS